MTLSPSRVAELRALLAKATPGERLVQSDGLNVRVIVSPHVTWKPRICSVFGTSAESQLANAAFIAECSPELLAHLLDTHQALAAIVQFCDDPNGSDKPDSLAMGLARLLPRARAIFNTEDC